MRVPTCRLVATVAVTHPDGASVRNECGSIQSYRSHASLASPGGILNDICTVLPASSSATKATILPYALTLGSIGFGDFVGPAAPLRRREHTVHAVEDVGERVEDLVRSGGHRPV